MKVMKAIKRFLLSKKFETIVMYFTFGLMSLVTIVMLILMSIEVIQQL